MDYPGGVVFLAIPPIECLLAKACIDLESDCWRWTGYKIRGYGTIGVAGRSMFVHRFAHEHWIGPIPEGHHVDHVRARGCTHLDCFNPDHLEAVTPAENHRRSRQAGVARARQLAKTHCPHGHPYAGENLYVGPDGGRYCRICYRARHRASYQARRKEAAE